MKRIVAVIFALAFSICAVGQGQKAESLFSEIDGISHDLEEITGLRFKHKVPSSVLDKDQLRKFLSSRIDKSMKPADLKAEALILKMLGLVPQDYDLRGETVDLLTEQAAAFYDYQKKKLFLMQGDTGEAALMALAHELSHALADQNFHLEKYIKQNSESDDAATARMAVMEGQASWLMSAYLRKRAGLTGDVPEPILKMMSNSVEEGTSQYPVFTQSPLYVRESLVFPYKSGMLFQDAVFRKLGKDGFAQVFRRAPVSTQQILHPERYLSHTAPDMPELPKVPEVKRYRKLAEGTLGEFDLSVLLRQFGAKDRVEELAPALSGSQFVLLESKSDKKPLLAFSSKWSSAEKAQEFYTFYKGALRTKSKAFESSSDLPDAFVGKGDSGFFRLSRKGDVVESIEGLKSSVN